MLREIQKAARAKRIVSGRFQWIRMKVLGRTPKKCQVQAIVTESQTINNSLTYSETSTDSVSSVTATNSYTVVVGSVSSTETGTSSISYTVHREMYLYSILISSGLATVAIMGLVGVLKLVASHHIW